MLPIFPILLHKFIVDDYDSNIRKELINYCYNERNNNPKGLKRSNKGNSWHSSDNQMDTENIASKTLLSSISNYFNKQNIFKEGTLFKISNAWININSIGGSNKLHNHPDSNLSGVFWVKIPKNSGNIIFHDSNNFMESILLSTYSHKMKSFTNKYPSFWVNPTEGVITIFPSHLMHEVEENLNEKNEDRISISFNMNLIPPSSINNKDTSERTPSL